MRIIDRITETEVLQDERLDYLIDAFKQDSIDYKGIEVPSDAEGKRRVLRSLMNIRMPGDLSENVLKVQDEYLSERIRENGIVSIADIPTASESLGSEHPFAEMISIWQGDITRIAADGIVNAANSMMLGCFIPMHTCIDNCIHTFAGVQLRSECNQRMMKLRSIHGSDYEQPTAIPMLTDAYNLPAKKVIHIVGPIVQGPLTKEHECLLADCYRNTLDLCAQNGLRSLAFCCISTGVFHFPNERAAKIAVETVTEWLSSQSEQGAGACKAGERAIDRIIFNVFKDEDRILYEKQFG